ncbi:MAG: oligosaccharide flippase family protein, partial [Methylococcaceae bacterium]
MHIKKNECSATRDIFIFLLDPITKSLIAKFSGADSAGLFEMANQLVLKIRSLIVSANQAVVPKIAHQQKGLSEKNKLIYSENIKLVVFFSAPLFSLIFASAHVASLLLLGRLDNQFVLFIHVLSIG